MPSLLTDKAWRWAIGVFLVARVAYSLWALIVVQLNPLLVSNLDLFGTPVVAAFDLRTSERMVYSRVVDGRELQFSRRGSDLADVETASVWDRAGSAIEGTLVGARLESSSYSAEDVYPYQGVAVSQDPLLAPWQRFDTNWYLKLASHGYAVEDNSTAFFPLYPILIRAVGTLFLGHQLLAAFAISNLAAIGSFWLLLQSAKEIIGDQGASRTLVYLALFPTAFFLLAAYTESLFLFLALASLRAGMRQRWFAMSIFATLAALTRLQGLVLLLPAIYLWLRSMRVGAGTRSLIWSGLAFLAIPLTTFGFLVFMRLSFFTSLEGGWDARIVPPWESLLASFGQIAGGRFSFVDLVNLTVSLLFGVVIVLGWKRLPVAYSLYAAAMLLGPLFRLTPTQPLVSMSRYVLPIFPVFLLLGKWGENPWVNRLFVYTSFPLNLYFSAQFVLWGWVA